MGASERNNGYHDAIFHSIHDSPLGAVEINTLMGVMFTLNTKGSGMGCKGQTCKIRAHIHEDIEFTHWCEIEFWEWILPSHTAL